MTHALQTIAESASRPMTKQPIPREGTDARMQGNMLCAEVFATVRLESNKWRTFALRIINGTTDMRAAFMAAVKEQLRSMREDNANAIANLSRDGKPDPSKEDTKTAGARVRAATVEISKLQTIANAFNGAATVEGLVQHACTTGRTKGATLDDVGYEVMVEYARLFNDSKGRGRKPDAWIVKLGKWLDQNKPAEDDAKGLEAHAKVVALFNSLKD